MDVTTARSGTLDRRVAAIRRFNRFYTKRIGVLEERLLQSPFSLAEARLLYELAQRETTTAAMLGKELGLDPAYLSRTLQSFEKRGLLARTPSPDDRRQTLLSLSAAGREAFAPLEAQSKDAIGAMLRGLSEAQQQHLLAGMETVEGLLGGERKRAASYLLRPHRIGDMGWVIARHGALYAEEYGWNEQFEALVAELTAKFLRQFDPQRERCWIAEINGETVGSVFLVKRSATIAQLRLLLVEPRARGLGIGRRLVEECVRFARQAGYRKIMLWTNSILVAARKLYEDAGFSLIDEKTHKAFGPELVGQTWRLDLHAAQPVRHGKRKRTAKP